MCRFHPPSCWCNVATPTILAPVPDHLLVLHPVFDEHAFALGYALKQFVEILLIGGAQGPQRGLFPVLKLDVFGKMLQLEFNAK